MSSSYYIHATRGDLPHYHRYIGGNSVGIDLQQLFDKQRYTEIKIEPGWDIFVTTYSDIIDMLENMSSNYVGVSEREIIIQEIKSKDEYCKWCIWYEY